MNKIIEDMPEKEYRAHPAVSQSDLKNLAKCPLYYKHQKENRIDTEAMKVGRAVHTYILEPKKFEKNFFVVDKNKINRKTKIGKELWAKTQEEAGEREIIWSEQLIAMQGMKEMLRNLEVNKGNKEKEEIIMIFDEMLKDSSKELSIFWQDPDTGIECKARIDGYNKYWNMLYDLKTTMDCIGFRRSFFKYQYHIQAAFYMDGIKEITKKTPEGFLIFAAEKEAPYLCKSYYTSFDDEVIKTGRDEYKYLLNLYGDCESKNNFNEALEKQVENIEYMPNWYKNIGE